MCVCLRRAMMIMSAVAAALAIYAPCVYADVTDEFNGGFNPALSWTWNVPNNNPLDTQTPSGYRFTGTTLNIDFQGGHPNGAGVSSIQNLPNLTITQQPANWYIETALSVDWSQVERTTSDNSYIQADLLVFDDTDNYTYMGNNWWPVTNNGEVYMGGNTEIGGIRSNTGLFGSEFWQGDANFVKMRLSGTPTAITFEYDRGNGWVNTGTLSASSTGDALRTYNYLSGGLAGKRIGLLATDGGAIINTPAKWDYLRTNLAVAQAVPEPGTFALLIGTAFFGANLLLRRRRK